MTRQHRDGVRAQPKTVYTSGSGEGTSPGASRHPPQRGGEIEMWIFPSPLGRVPRRGGRGPFAALCEKTLTSQDLKKTPPTRAYWLLVSRVHNLTHQYRGRLLVDKPLSCAQLAYANWSSGIPGLHTCLSWHVVDTQHVRAAVPRNVDYAAKGAFAPQRLSPSWIASSRKNIKKRFHATEKMNFHLGHGARVLSLALRSNHRHNLDWSPKWK